jgi:hypothetical protein
MSRPKQKRSHASPSSRVEALSAVIAGLRPKCQAIIVELPDGPLILMACPTTARCPRCDDARRRQGPREVGPTAKPTPGADNATSPEEE